MDKKEFWQNKNIFITGASGFLGSWLVQELNRFNVTTVGLVRDSRNTPKAKGLDSISTDYSVQGQLEDYQLLIRALNEYEIDIVFHLGAQPIVGIANRNPLSTFKSNIEGTWNILEACRQIPSVKQVVIASSDKAYGQQDKLPYDESMSLQGKHPYDVSKSCTDLIAQTYHHTYELPVCITRCGNFFGGRDLNFNRIVPGTIRSLLMHEVPIIRSNGSCIRDYVYVKDVVQFYMTIAEKMIDPSIHGHAFNYSIGSQQSVLDIVKRISTLMGQKELSPKLLNLEKGEIPHQYLCSDKARKMLNWQPQYTMDDALIETIAWYRQYFSLQQNNLAEV